MFGLHHQTPETPHNARASIISDIVVEHRIRMITFIVGQDHTTWYLAQIMAYILNMKCAEFSKKPYLNSGSDNKFTICGENVQCIEDLKLWICRLNPPVSRFISVPQPALYVGKIIQPSRPRYIAA